VILSTDYNEAGDGRLLLDDGSCIADLFVLPKEAEGGYWRPGTPALNLAGFFF
jgi:RecQ-mediated genome instability protein 2